MNSFQGVCRPFISGWLSAILLIASILPLDRSQPISDPATRILKLPCGNEIITDRDITRMTNAEKLAKIDALLNTIPSFNCKPGCADCCGPFDLSRLEFYRCVKASGRSVEYLRQQIERNSKRNDLSCPLLDKKTKRCSVYEVRPAICRVFGTTKGLPCPHGYGPKPEKMLDDQNAKGLLAMVKELGA